MDTRGFSQWVPKIMSAFRKTASEVLNSAAGDTALWAIKFTHRASYQEMVDKFTRAGWHGKTLKSGKTSKGAAKKYQTFEPSGLVYFILAYYRKHGQMPPESIGIMPKAAIQAGLKGEVAAMLFVKAKLRSIAYIATGFVMTARFFGKQTTTKISTKGYVFHSTGEKATEKRLVAKIHNYARDAGKKNVKEKSQTERALALGLVQVAIQMKKNLNRAWKAVKKP